ncbi:MAG: hypothetical protein CM15mV105_180 [uncultured marine virus]|nr:MAG: hypothetical protein CM15mV105_180 [uncultured marine virus]
MDDTLIIAEDYLLKQGVQVGVQRQDVATNEYYNDIGFANYVRLIGTEKQIEEYRATQDWEMRGVYEYDLQNSEKRDFYLDMHKNNNDKALAIIIR